MKVVLNQDIKGMGKKLDVINVSEGYARNYLLPRKLANIADNKAVSESQTKKEAIAYKKDQEHESALEHKKELEKIVIKFKQKVGESGKLFGSVTEKDIAERVENEYKIKLDKKKIKLNVQIKNIGSYTVEVKLYEGVVAKFKVVIEEL